MQSVASIDSVAAGAGGSTLFPDWKRSGENKVVEESVSFVRLVKALRECEKVRKKNGEGVDVYIVLGSVFSLVKCHPSI